MSTWYGLLLAPPESVTFDVITLVAAVGTVLASEGSGPPPRATVSVAGPHATKSTAPLLKLGYPSMSLRELVQLDRQKLQARRTLAVRAAVIMTALHNETAARGAPTTVSELKLEQPWGYLVSRAIHLRPA